MAAVPSMTFDLDIGELRQSELASLTERLMPHILAGLRALAPAEARAIAGEAAAHRPLDGVSLAALADWLRDQQFGGMAEQVAALRSEAGQVVILHVLDRCSTEQMVRLRDSLTAALPEGVSAIVLPAYVRLVGITSKE